MGGPSSVYRWLVLRLPPRAGWILWRVAVAVASARRRRVAGPRVAVAHVAWGASERRLAELVERLCREAGAEPARMLVISDSAAVHVAAAHGCRLEHVPPRDEWERRFPGASYESFLGRRGASIAASYAIERLELEEGVPESLRRALSGDGRP